MALDTRKFLERFLEEAREHLTELSDGIDALGRNPGDRVTLDSVFRSAHTIKGSSRMLKLGAISTTAHQLEDLLDAVRSGTLEWSDDIRSLLHRGTDALAGLVDRTAGGETVVEPDPDLLETLTAPLNRKSVPLEPSEPTTAEAPRLGPDLGPKTGETVRVRLEKLDELIKLMGEVVSNHRIAAQRLTEIEAIQKLPAPREALVRFAQDLKDDERAQDLLMKELHAKALVMRMLPLSLVFDPMARMVRDLGRTLGKDVDFQVFGSEIELDRQMIDKLGDPVVHLLRNALDHGLEPPEARSAAGKPRGGKVTLGARQDGRWVVVEVTDDGAGISLEAIRDKTLRKGLLTREKLDALGTRELVDLIFLPGFSTSPIITDVSGRGVGLDVVKKSVVHDLGGTVTVDTTPGKGTVFSLRIPLSLAVLRILTIRSGDRVYGFTAPYVSELVRKKDDEIQTVAGRRSLVLRNEFVPVVRLDELVSGVQPKPGRGQKSDGQLLLVVQVRNEKLALGIDSLVDERDMVIKPLPAHLRHNSLVSGMVTTGRNELVSVLHVPALVDKVRAARKEAQEVSAADAKPSVKVLVVDDSLNTREIEKDVLDANGYQVTLAEDGLDGWTKAQAEKFDAVLTDVEMPRMDGFTLTERLRQDDRYRDTPIIIITSRQREEDKRRGIAVGADAYIVKGDFEQGSLVDTLRKLGL